MPNGCSVGGTKRTRDPQCHWPSKRDI